MGKITESKIGKRVKTSFGDVGSEFMCAKKYSKRHGTKNNMSIPYNPD